MVLVTCLDEERLTGRGIPVAPEGVTEHWLVFSGDRETFEAALEKLDISAGRSIHLGPVDPGNYPLWWWGWSLAARMTTPPVVIRECAGGEDQVFSVSDFGLSSNAVINAWHECSVRGARSLHDSVRCARILCAALAAQVQVPRNASSGVDLLKTYLSAAADYLKALFLDPNPTSPATFQTHSAVINATVELAANHLSGFSRQVQAIGGTCPSVPGAALLNLQRGMARGENREDVVARRQREWAAIFYLRGKSFRNEGRSNEAVVSSWRALECYATSIGLKTSVVELQAKGDLRWGPQAFGVATRDVTMDQLLTQLLGLGFGGGQLSASITLLRRFRNKCIWGHGLLSADLAEADAASALVKRTIDTYEAGTGAFSNSVASLGDLPVLTKLPAILLGSIGQ